MNPNQLINNTISKLYEEYSDVLSIINRELKNSKYLGGQLRIKLNIAIDPKHFNNLSIIYRYLGWKYVIFKNKIINDNIYTIIQFNNHG